MNYDTYLNFRLTKKQKAELVKEAKENWIPVGTLVRKKLFKVH
jgi:hypothetical protein